MARRKSGGGKPPEERGRKPRVGSNTPKRPKKPAEEGTDTNPDTHLVNAMETDPGFFKDPLIGTSLGKCKIGKLLGEGKTAVVYRAVYAPLRRTVAVKVLQEHMKKVPAVLRVFQQEGRAVAALDHENILKIYDVGEDDGKHYLVLELLAGRDLLKRIEETKDEEMPLEEALDYVRQAAAGLAAAHRKNLVHRDIKPQNLVVEPDGTLKIVDFGLAADAEGAFAGGRLGTPHYMSPEQCRGEGARTASDIYALGITLFHMLVGHPPYSGLHSTEEIIAEHLKGQRLEPEKLRRSIPKTIAELVRKMTRSDPDARPTAKELVEVISRLTPSQLEGDKGVRGRGGRRGARKPGTPMTPILLLGGVVVIGVIVVLAMGGREDSSADAPAPPVTPAPVAATPTEKPDRAPVNRTLEQELRDLMADAVREESTGNFMEAHGIYTRVKLKSKADHPLYKQADAAAAMLMERINAEKGNRTGREKKVFITASDSERAGEEFDERQEEFSTLLRSFQISAARAEMDKLLARTREATPERERIDAGMRRLAYLESLVGMIEGRAGTLTGGREAWSKYDRDAGPDERVLGADEKGIRVMDEAQGREQLHTWANLDMAVTVRFLDSLRISKSASECLWLAYFCKIMGDPTADAYFDLALLLDNGPGMAADVRALRDK